MNASMLREHVEFFQSFHANKIPFLLFILLRILLKDFLIKIDNGEKVQQKGFNVSNSQMIYTVVYEKRKTVLKALEKHIKMLLKSYKAHMC